MSTFMKMRLNTSEELKNKQIQTNNNNKNKSENTRILDDSVNSTRLKMSSVGKARKCAAMQFTGNRKCKSCGGK